MVHLTTGRRLIPSLGLAAMALIATPVNADDVHLVDGDLIRGTIVTQDDTKVVLEHPTLGRLEIARDRIESITPTPTLAGEPAMGVEVKAEDDPAPVAPPAEAKDWKFALNLSANGSWGNTDEQSLRVGFTGKRKRVDTRLSLDASYYGGITNGDTTDNSLTAGVLHDWLRPGKRVFFFGQGRYDFDQFESWDHRISAHAGPGYHFIEKDDLTVDLRVGGGTVREWGSETTAWRFEALFGVDVNWTISDRSGFEFTSQYLPVIDNWTDDYRVVSRVDFKFKLDPELNLSLVAGLRHEYESVVDPGDDRNNTKAFIGLQVDF